MTPRHQQLVKLALEQVFGDQPYVLLVDEGSGAGIVTNVQFADPDNRERLRVILCATLHALDDQSRFTMHDIPTDLSGGNPENN